MDIQPGQGAVMVSILVSTARSSQTGRTAAGQPQHVRRRVRLNAMIESVDFRAGFLWGQSGPHCHLSFAASLGGGAMGCASHMGPGGGEAAELGVPGCVGTRLHGGGSLFPKPNCPTFPRGMRWKPTPPPRPAPGGQGAAGGFLSCIMW